MTLGKLIIGVLSKYNKPEKNNYKDQSGEINKELEYLNILENIK